jgi:hypothetical protein
VSNLGRVRSLFGRWGLRKEPLIRKGVPDKYGHLYLNLQNEHHPREKPLRKSIHQLVAGAFIGPRPVGYETRHMDGNPTNNVVSNLAYGTKSDNSMDAVRHGTHPGFQNRKRSAA